ncbi:MAG TPA: clostripain-related cysteine peptidase, partial [Geobacteraceae bacterium]|nr:clostripain-related cysteine peptidase [Geobacteraceae bacterium]
MKNTIFRLSTLFSLLTVLFFTASCGGGGSSSKSSTPVTGNKWTVMVYLDGDNNLTSASTIDLEEMEAVGSTENVTFIVQHDTQGGTTKRYKVEKGSLTLLADLGELDMSAGSTLRDFVVESARAYPADHYALIVWDHGQGWKAASADTIAKSIFNDVDNGNRSSYLSNYYVAAALAEAESSAGIKLDIFGVDACEMAVLEAAYEFRNVAHIFVASQELVSSYGWNYSDLFGRLVNDPGMTPKEFATAMVSSFKKFYQAAGYTDQAITALALSSLYSSDGNATIGTVAVAVDDLSQRLLALMASPSTRTATLATLTSAR